MQLIDAKKLVTRMRLLSLLVLIVSALFLACAFLKSLSFAMAGDTSPLANLSHAIQRGVYFIYERTQFVAWVWHWAPVVNPTQLNSSGNFGFLFLCCCGALGRVIWDSASHLASRIKKTIQRIEELGWERSLLAQQGMVAGTKPDVLAISIELEQKDQWYK
jgi:hypothetical protein